MYITDKNYNEKVMSYQKSFGLVFISKTCNNCKGIEKMIRESKYEYKIFFVKAEESENILQMFNIRAFPSIYFFDENKNSEKIIIGSKIDEMKKFIESKEITKKKKKFGIF